MNFVNDAPVAASLLFVQLRFHRGDLTVRSVGASNGIPIESKVVRIPIGIDSANLNYAFAIQFQRPVDPSTEVSVEIECFTKAIWVVGKKWIEGRPLASRENIIDDLGSWILSYEKMREVFQKQHPLLSDNSMKEFWFVLDGETYLHTDVKNGWRRLNDPLRPLLTEEEICTRWNAINRVGKVHLAGRYYDRMKDRVPTWASLTPEAQQDIDVVGRIFDCLFREHMKNGDVDSLGISFLEFATGDYRRVVSSPQKRIYLNGEPDSDAFLLMPEIIFSMIDSGQYEADWSKILPYAVAALAVFGWVYSPQNPRDRDFGKYSMKTIRCERPERVDVTATAKAYTQMNSADLHTRWIRTVKRIYASLFPRTCNDPHEPIEEFITLK